MIRRMFWLSAGAAIGISAYRRVQTLGRAASAALAPPGGAGTAPAAGRPRGGATGQGAVARIGGAVRFARDVREGMGIYTDRHRGRLGPRLGRSAAWVPALCPATAAGAAAWT